VESDSELPSEPPPPLPPEEETQMSSISLDTVHDPAHWFENPEDNDESGGTIGEELSLEPNDEMGDLSMHTREISLDDAPQDVFISESEDLLPIDE
jgi:hypothetical protein